MNFIVPLTILEMKKMLSIKSSSNIIQSIVESFFNSQPSPNPLRLQK